MNLRTILLTALISAGCYSPRFKNDIACDPAGACPPGTTCGNDGKCHAPGTDTGSDIPDAPVVIEVDAGEVMIDARPVGCSADPDCATAPDLCSKAGTCNPSTHVCTFVAVDCSGLNDECSRGTCETATGHCIKAPINGGVVCGAGTVCGAFGACGGVDSVCDTSGTQMRSCTQNTCQAGVCTANVFSETQACDRTVTTCGTPTITNCSACDYSSECDEDASQTCTCTEFDCQSGACVPVSTSCAQTCHRSTEGNPCNGATCVNFRTKECQRGLCVTTDC